VKAGIVGDAREDGPQDACGLAQLAADGMVPAGARQIDWIRRRSERCWSRRKQLLGRLLDVELSIRGILRGFGLKVWPGDAQNV